MVLHRRRESTLFLKQNRIGWLFIVPAVSVLICFLFYPMIEGLIISLQSKGELSFSNYNRLLSDTKLRKTIKNTFFYVIIEIGIMLPLAMIMAVVLQRKRLKFRKIFRTLLFLPCTMSLMSYATVFKLMFGNYGIINKLLLNLQIISEPYPFLTTVTGARLVLAICLVWRWSGYNMIYYISGLSNIDETIYEAAELDGANSFHRFTRITVPMLRPIILLTMILSVNGTLQIMDEIRQLTEGGPADSTLSISLYIYNTAFDGSPKFGYACAISFALMMIIVMLTIIQMKVGDKRD